MPSLIPGWAPNVHPLVIHFPIVLVMTAVVVDLIDVVFERSPWLQMAATTLYVTGALSMAVAYVTGLQAAETVLVPGMAYPVLTQHRQWALVTMVYCMGIAAMRLVMVRGPQRRGRRVALLAIGVVAIVLVQQTAERGARLVYEYGTGIIGR